MGYRKRRYFTEAACVLMWDRWQAGDPLHQIARLLDRGHGAVAGRISRTGGIRPAARCRSSRTLSLAEREEILRGIVAGLSIRAIASRLSRAPSTVSREINRNGGRDRYRATEADAAVWQRAHRPKTCKLAQNSALARIVAEKLQLEWSPRQIAGWLKYHYPDDETYQVSHETIYLTLFIQARGALKKELLKYLRRPRAMRRSRHSNLKGKGLGQITNAVSIRERPVEAAGNSGRSEFSIARERETLRLAGTACNHACQKTLRGAT